jgi:myosin heavy subunit
VKKATFESSKKKEIGVSDLTLLSKISNEAINENLKLRFQHDEIYVRDRSPTRTAGLCAKMNIR